MHFCKPFALSIIKRSHLNKILLIHSESHLKQVGRCREYRTVELFRRSQALSNAEIFRNFILHVTYSIAFGFVFDAK